MYNLCGVWHLESIEIFTRDGKNVLLFGANPCGRLIYTANGYMSVIITAKVRKNVGFILDDLYSKPFGWKKMLGFLRLIHSNLKQLSYSGRYSIDGNLVVHHVDIASFPDWVGSQLIRQIILDGNMLTLKTREMKDDVHACVIWQKEPLCNQSASSS